MTAIGAIKHALALKVDVEAKLGTELIERIDDLFYFYNYNTLAFRGATLIEYEKLKGPLGFATRNTVQNP